MIRLRERFSAIISRFKEEKKPEPLVQVDPDNVYHQLKMALLKFGSAEVHLKASPASLGSVESFSENLDDFLKSLLEVNDILKEKKHIQNGTFYIKHRTTVRLDQLLFVSNGFYINDTEARVMKIIEQIDVYYEYMKDANEVAYGPMEHNHRQLYGYTQTLTEFVLAIVKHFGQQ